MPKLEIIKCFICKKEVGSKNLKEIYFLCSWTIVAYICSEKCEKKFRLKHTDQLTGMTRAGYAFEHPVKVAKMEKMKPLVSREKHKKSVKKRNEYFKSRSLEIPIDDILERLKKNEIEE